ncbi:MAG TPA: efflux transporter outer membrane subunit [Steroidobacteraceae bacterium]|jgi:NodT family efflux transporter outer membrane factor (OMF) lipoprotein|nr:efflux transporter outer membrane subunit [Steroidobacteraceae bacterium]
MSPIRCAARSLVPVAVAIVLAGCALGPNYKRPETATTDHYKNPVAATPQAVPPDKWWALFGDPTLNDLEQQVEVSNQNIAQAAAAYMQARAVVRQDRSSLLPSIGVSGGVTRSGGSSGAFGGTGTGSIVVPTRGSSTTTSYQLDPSATWELDVWGRLRRTLENAHDSAQASAADLANAKLSAQSQLAIAYLQLRGTDAQRKLLADTEEAYKRTLTITNNRYKAGTAARTDVLQAETQLYSAQDQEQSDILQRAQLENAIAALIGKPASGFTVAALDSWDIPMPEIPAGLPSDLLQRRPDIVVAERQMAAANAIIGVQEANFFPAITLTGSYGFVSTAASTLFDKANLSHSIGASLSQTLLDFGGRRAQVDQARNAYAQAVASYKQSVLTAFQDVENDLAAAAVYRTEFDLRTQNSEAADMTEKLTLNEYKAGTVDFTTVVVAQTAALSARLQLAQMRVLRQTDAVTLVTDLGGGWQAPDFTHYQ